MADLTTEIYKGSASIELGGTLYTGAKGDAINKLAFAQQIYDDELKEYQSNLNKVVSDNQKKLEAITFVDNSSTNNQGISQIKLTSSSSDQAFIKAEVGDDITKVIIEINDNFGNSDDADTKGNDTFQVRGKKSITGDPADNVRFQVGKTVQAINSAGTALERVLTVSDLTNTALKGTPTAPTAAATTSSTQVATTAFVQSAIENKLAANDAMLFKGTIGTGGTVTALPATHNAGWTYKVITAGTYAGIVCEVGDLIICIADGTAANNAHWTVAQTNIDGAVTGPASATSGAVALFDGTTGKVIKNSATVGSATKPIYLNNGVPTASASTVGSATRPVYLNAGTITAGTYTFGNASGNAAINNGTVNTNLNADLLDGVQGINYAYFNNQFNFLCGESRAAITTEQFIERLTELGAFTHREWATKCSWSYANNDIITDTGCGDIQLAGAVIKVYAYPATNYFIEVITSPAVANITLEDETTTAAVANAVFIYRNNGSGYGPNWKRLMNYASNYLTVGTSGVVEGGRYFDFHSSNYGTNNTEDYTARFDAGSASTKRILTLPTTTGTLALTSDIVQSDWNVTSTTSNAYIKNKPDFTALANRVTELEGKLLVLQTGAKVTTTVNPATIYKGVATNVTVTGTFSATDSSLTPTSIEIKQGSTSVVSATNAKTTSKVVSLNTTTNTTAYTTNATVNGVALTHTVNVNARYPIYYGFSTSVPTTAAFTGSTKVGATTTASREYSGTCSANSSHFYVLIPSDITVPTTFTMGGAPFVMNKSTATLGGVSYTILESGSIYNNGATVNVKM